MKHLTQIVFLTALLLIAHFLPAQEEFKISLTTDLLPQSSSVAPFTSEFNLLKSYPGFQEVLKVEYYPFPSRQFEKNGVTMVEYYFNELNKPTQIRIDFTLKSHLQYFESGLIVTGENAPEDPEELLISNQYINHKNKTIEILASTLKADNEFETLKNIVNFIGREIKLDLFRWYYRSLSEALNASVQFGNIPTYGSTGISVRNTYIKVSPTAKASSVLKDRIGNEVELHLLFIALCRAAGLPAKLAIGLVERSGFDLSLSPWSEVYIEGYGWLLIDINKLSPDAEDHFMRFFKLSENQEIAINLDHPNKLFTAKTANVKTMTKALIFPSDIRKRTIYNKQLTFDHIQDISKDWKNLVHYIIDGYYYLGLIPKSEFLFNLLLNEKDEPQPSIQFQAEIASALMDLGTKFSDRGYFEVGLQFFQWAEENYLNFIDPQHDLFQRLYSWEGFCNLRLANEENANLFFKKAIDMPITDRQLSKFYHDFAKLGLAINPVNTENADKKAKKILEFQAEHCIDQFTSHSFCHWLSGLLWNAN